MYAVVETGGKQYRVEQGQRLAVELLRDETVTLKPVLLVDGDDVFSTPAQLAGATVTANVVGASRGPKINGFTYKDKTNQRRRFGHRQHYSEIEIVSISKG